MDKNNIISDLYDRDTKEAYNKFLQYELKTLETDELYNYFNEFIDMLKSENTYIRVRGFRLICSLSKWDKLNKINKNIDVLLNELNEEKPTSLRQCLKAIHVLLLYKPELTDKIEKKLREINYMQYKESMQGLIKKDIDEILKNI